MKFLQFFLILLPVAVTNLVTAFVAYQAGAEKWKKVFSFVLSYFTPEERARVMAEMEKERKQYWESSE